MKSVLVRADSLGGDAGHIRAGIEVATFLGESLQILQANELFWLWRRDGDGDFQRPGSCN